MNYIEFNQYTIIEDKENPFSTLFKIDDQHFFYIEPAFYSQLLGFKSRISEDDYDNLIKEIIKCVLNNGKVIFTSNFENPQTEKEGFIYREIEDVANLLKIYAEDKSRGSDYGD